MIKVVVRHHQSIRQISITGHAFSGEPGHDLVCAGVSAISIGVCNTIEKKGYLNKNNCFIKLDSGKIKIDVIGEDPTLQVILETLVISLESIQETYQEYIKVIHKEE